MTELNVREAVDNELERFIRKTIQDNLGEQDKPLSRTELEDAIASYVSNNPEAAQPSEDQVSEIVAREVSSYIRNNMDQFQSGSSENNGGLDASNPIMYGADPNEGNDASEAFIKAAQATGVITLPAGAKFLIDTSTELPARSVIRGQAFMHFGNSNYQIRRGNSIPADQPMLSNVYMMENVSLRGKGKNGPGVLLTGYCCRVLNCSFNEFTEAVQIPAGSVDRFAWNQFVGCDYGIRNTLRDGSSVITTTSFEYNHFQYVTNPIDYHEGQMFSCQWIGNVFERVSGDAIRASFLRDCRFADNWWEHRDGGSDGKEIFTLSRSNESYGNYFGTAHTQAGWRNQMAEDPADNNGMTGGMTFQNDMIQLQGRTQGGVRLTKHGLFQRHSAWTPSAYPFTIESGRGSGNGAAAHLDLVSPRNVRIKARNGIDLMSSRSNPEYSTYPIRILNRAQKDDEGEYTNLRWTTLEGVRGRWAETKPNMAGTVDIGKDEERLANIAIPTMVVFSPDGKENNTTQFDSVNYDTEGQISVQSPYQFQNPSLQVTVEDRGVFFDGMEWSGGSSTDNERKATGFTLFFVDREGNPVTPKYVHMQIAIFPYNTYKA